VDLNCGILPEPYWEKNGKSMGMSSLQGHAPNARSRDGLKKKHFSQKTS